MGLNVKVDVTPDELDNTLELGISVDNEALDDTSNREDLAHVQRILESRGDIDETECLSVSNGSYRNLHPLRRAYALLKECPLDKDGEVMYEGEILKSHLVNHEDNEGWYLPDDFPEPIWGKGREISIGSSDRLLEELRELGRPEGSTASSSWDTLFICALASTLHNKVIRFC